MLYVPIRYVKEWQYKYPEWNDYVIGTFFNRYQELLTSFNSVVFSKIESRLIDYLSTASAAADKQQVKITHLALANELGTTRVVVSRILKMLEDRGIVMLSRGEIKLVKN